MQRLLIVCIVLSMIINIRASEEDTCMEFVVMYKKVTLSAEARRIVLQIKSHLTESRVANPVCAALDYYKRYKNLRDDVFCSLACDICNIEAFTYLAREQCCDINMYFLLLQYAFYHKSEIVVDFLANRVGIPVDISTLQGDPYFHQLILKNNDHNTSTISKIKTIIGYLIADTTNKIDINHVNINGETFLDIINNCLEFNKEYETIHTYLVSNGGHYGVFGNKKQIEAIAQLLKEKNLRTVYSMILKGGLCLDIPYDLNNGYTLLMRASYDNCLSIVKILIDHGANPNIKCKKGLTAADIAGKQNHYDLRNYLLDCSFAQESDEKNFVVVPELNSIDDFLII